MDEVEIKELREQNVQLRSLVVSLSAMLMRKVVDEREIRRSPDSADAERLLREAEECFRCARIPWLKSEIAEGLEAAGRELSARAVEIETKLQRGERNK